MTDDEFTKWKADMRALWLASVAPPAATSTATDRTSGSVMPSAADTTFMHGCGCAGPAVVTVYGGSGGTGASVRHVNGGHGSGSHNGNSPMSVPGGGAGGTPPPLVPDRARPPERWVEGSPCRADGCTRMSSPGGYCLRHQGVDVATALSLRTLGYGFSDTYYCHVLRQFQRDFNAVRILVARALGEPVPAKLDEDGIHGPCTSHALWWAPQRIQRMGIAWMAIVSIAIPFARGEGGSL